MAEKTEAPTGKRIHEARSEARVARSPEVNGALALLIGTLLLRSSGGNLVASLSNQLTHSLTNLPTREFTQSDLSSLLIYNIMGITPSLSLIVLALLATGVVATVSQTGFLWATKKVGFDLSKLNPMPGIKRLFSSQGIFELVKALLKLSLVGFVVYNFLRGRVPELLDLGQMELLTGMSSWAVLAGDLALQVAEVYLVLAVGDYVYQRWRYDKSMKMSKEEVKEEMKQNEGDPFLKGRIRSQQRKMARMRMMSNVKKADVIITNPTHLAIAIQYDPQTMRAPIVLAKGAHLTAQRIVALARESNIPVIQNIPLARAIYKTVEIEHEIPPELYVAMAEVLSYVYKIRGNSPVAAMM